MKETSEKNGLENIFKPKDVEILAPIKRKGLPCSKDKTNVCLNYNCKRRIYTLTKAQVRNLELSNELHSDACDIKDCKKKLYPKFIKLSFCIKSKSPNPNPFIHVHIPTRPPSIPPSLSQTHSHSLTHTDKQTQT